MARYLVTGAAGFIGARTSEMLVEDGHSVVGVDNLNDAYDVRMKEHRLAALQRLPGFDFRRLDISTASDLARWAVLLYTGKAMSWPYVHPMLESRAPHEGPGGHGLGVSISETSLGEAWGHDGEFPGYRSKMAYFPRERVAVAVQVNANRADLGAIVVRLARDVARR